MGLKSGDVLLREGRISMITDVWSNEDNWLQRERRNLPHFYTPIDSRHAAHCSLLGCLCMLLLLLQHMETTIGICVRISHRHSKPCDRMWRKFELLCNTIGRWKHLLGIRHGRTDPVGLRNTLWMSLQVGLRVSLSLSLRLSLSLCLGLGLGLCHSLLLGHKLESLELLHLLLLCQHLLLLQVRCKELWIRLRRRRFLEDWGGRRFRISSGIESFACLVQDIIIWPKLSTVTLVE